MLLPRLVGLPGEKHWFFQVVAPEIGMTVKKSPVFKGDESGRVCGGTGLIMGVNELGNLRVYWPSGDFTTWTRCSGGFFDVARADR